jgi:hypothetical protein
VDLLFVLERRVVLAHVLATEYLNMCHVDHERPTNIQHLLLVSSQIISSPLPSLSWQEVATPVETESRARVGRTARDCPQFQFKGCRTTSGRNWVRSVPLPLSLSLLRSRWGGFSAQDRIAQVRVHPVVFARGMWHGLVLRRAHIEVFVVFKSVDGERGRCDVRLKAFMSRNQSQNGRCSGAMNRNALTLKTPSGDEIQRH